MSRPALLIFQCVISILLLTAPIRIVQEIQNFRGAIAGLTLPGGTGKLDRQEDDQAVRTSLFGGPDRALADSISRSRLALVHYRSIATLGVMANALVGLLTCGFGLLLTWRSAERVEVRALLLLVALMASDDLGFDRFGIVEAFYVAGGVLIFGAGLLRFAALFPRPLTERDLLGIHYNPVPDMSPTSWLARFRASGAAQLQRLEIVLLKPSATWGLAASAAIAVLLIPPAVSGDMSRLLVWQLPLSSMAQRYAVLHAVQRVIFPLGFLLFATLVLTLVVQMIIALDFLRRGYSLASISERRRFVWIIQGFYGFAAVLALGVLVSIVAIPRFVIEPERPFVQSIVGGFIGIVAQGVLVGSLVFAVLQRGAVDPQLALRRTIVYAALSLLILAVFSGVEYSVSNFIVNLLPAVRGLGGWVAGVTVALTLAPLRTLLKSGTDRFFDRLSPATALAQEGERRDSIVVFSDLVGYTAAAAEDANTAMTLAALFHKEARATAEKLSGRLVKKIGDAVLLEFRDAGSAVRWSVQISDRLELGCALLDLPQTLLRTGVHAGEVVHSADGDLYGTTVNVASRLQTGANPAEILLSRAVIDRMAIDTPGIRIQRVGERRFKNVPEPIECFRCERVTEGPRT